LPKVENTGAPDTPFLSEVNLIMPSQFAHWGESVGAAVNSGVVYVRQNQDLYYYTINLAHEFIHLYLDDRYGNILEYNFLKPYDYAFMYALNEAAANTWEQWVRVHSPEFAATRDRASTVLGTSEDTTFETLENRARQKYPGQSESWYIRQAARDFFAYYLQYSDYMRWKIPLDLTDVYGADSLCLIPAYQIYTQEPYATELKKDFFETAVALLPFDLEPSVDFDSCNNQFSAGIQVWQGLPANPEDPRTTIDYWVNHADYIRMAQQRFLQHPEWTFGYVDEEKIAKLNQALRNRSLTAPTTPRPLRPDAALLNSWRQNQR
jgi:hypothetical protein